MSLTDEQMDTIIEAHTDTVDGLKARIVDLETKTKDMASLQKKLEQAETSLSDPENGGWKDKHDALKKEFDNYKADQAKKELHAAKEQAYRGLLQQAGVSEKRLDSVIRISDVDKIQLLDDGKVKDADQLTADIKREWADFIVKTETTGAPTSSPPVNAGGGAKTKEEILAIKDGGERRKAMADHPHLFGLTTANT